jgi:hypothetical protein
MYIPCEASSWTLLHQNRKLSSRISLQNQLFCLCRLPAVWNESSFSAWLGLNLSTSIYQCVGNCELYVLMDGFSTSPCSFCIAKTIFSTLYDQWRKFLLSSNVVDQYYLRTNIGSSTIKLIKQSFHTLLQTYSIQTCCWQMKNVQQIRCLYHSFILLFSAWLDNKI